MTYAAQAQELVQRLNNCLYASPYDIAWMAQLRAADGQSPRWPDLLDWLLTHQWPDGSWGGTIPYYHDRILCTLASIIALREHDSNGVCEAAIQRGTQYIWRNLHHLRTDLVEAAGFELLLPTLLAKARQINIGVPEHFCGYGRIRDSKLRLLPLDMLYKPGTTVAFSLEFLGSEGDPNKLPEFQGPQGAIANSPATTAYMVLQSPANQKKALAYLDQLPSLPNGIPHFYPYRTFEIAWVLEHLAFGNIPIAEVVPPAIWQELQSAVTDRGVAFDPAFGIKDGDTTAVTLHVLAQGGYTVNPEVLRLFEKPGTRTFWTFEYERNASIGTNIHALEALSLLPDYPDREFVWERVLATLLEQRLYESFWIDKWHISPYYATAHVLAALINIEQYSVIEQTHSVDWLLHTQHADGTWGYYGGGTVEETAYALLALLHYHDRIDRLDADIFKRGITHLYQAYETNPRYPELWIAKTLYTPEGVVKALILAVLALYEQVLGQQPA